MTQASSGIDRVPHPLRYLRLSQTILIPPTSTAKHLFEDARERARVRCGLYLSGYAFMPEHVSLLLSESASKSPGSSRTHPALCRTLRCLKKIVARTSTERPRRRKNATNGDAAQRIRRPRHHLPTAKPRRVPPFIAVPSRGVGSTLPKAGAEAEPQRSGSPLASHTTESSPQTPETHPRQALTGGANHPAHHLS